MEGFSGTGKTTLARELERRGWTRLPESAHMISSSIPVAERAGTFADFSLLGATMANCGIIASERNRRAIVSEGYLLSDLAYARVRLELKKSGAFPPMLEFCRKLLARRTLRPDLYVVLEAGEDALGSRQKRKSARDRNDSASFRSMYYRALSGVHKELGETKVVHVMTDRDPSATLDEVLRILKRRGIRA